MVVLNIQFNMEIDECLHSSRELTLLHIKEHAELVHTLIVAFKRLVYIFVHLLLDNRSCLLSGSIYSFFLSCSTWEVFLLCQKASSVVICRYRQMHWFLLLAFIFLSLSEL